MIIEDRIWFNSRHNSYKNVQIALGLYLSLIPLHYVDSDTYDYVRTKELDLVKGKSFLSGEVNRSLQKSLLNPVLSTFSEALVASLSVPDSHTSDAGLKTEVDPTDFGWTI